MIPTLTVDPLVSHAPRRRATIAALAAVALACAGAVSAPTPARAGEADDAVAELRENWEIVRYKVPPPDREKRFEALAIKARKVSESWPNRSEPLIWEGIILSSWAGEAGGLGALGTVKRAKALYESAIQIDGQAMDGSAYGSLGVLYYKVPGWPIGFGDKAKAAELLQKALSINPKGIDPNFFYGEYLYEIKRPDEATTYLERALQAPSRTGRPIADAGRREEIRALLDKIRAQ